LDTWWLRRILVKEFVAPAIIKQESMATAGGNIEEFMVDEKRQMEIDDNFKRRYRPRVFNEKFAHLWDFIDDKSLTSAGRNKVSIGVLRVITTRLSQLSTLLPRLTARSIFFHPYCFISF
jgi:hypothetical protein